MEPRLSYTTYMPPPSPRRKYTRNDTPTQPFCLRWYGGPPCQTVTSGNPDPLVAGTAWDMREGCHWSKITPLAIGPPRGYINSPSSYFRSLRSTEDYLKRM